MIKIYTYPDIKGDTYDKMGYFHTLGNLNALLSLGLQGTTNALQRLPVTVQLSFDRQLWFDALTWEGLDEDETKFIPLGKDYHGIAALRLLPGTAQTYTLTVCEYAYPL